MYEKKHAAQNKKPNAPKRLARLTVTAADIILNAKYASCTEVGNGKDATSLGDMLGAIKLMKSVNAYRASVGLPELQVTYKLIAGAIADANYSGTVGHYMNIINPDFAVAGMGICTKGFHYGMQANSYTASWSGWEGSGWNTNPMSVEEYERNLTSYIASFTRLQDDLDSAKSDLASSQQPEAPRRQRDIPAGQPRPDRRQVRQYR